MSLHRQGFGRHNVILRGVVGGRKGGNLCVFMFEDFHKAKLIFYRKIPLSKP